MAGNPCFALLWLILLVFIAWPVAAFCAGIWIFFMPFEACCACAKDCSDVFGRFTTWPRDCGTAIMNCHTNCPAP